MRRTYTVRSDSLEEPSVPLSAANISSFLYGTTDDAGVAVTARTALGYAPLYQAVSMISGDEANCPRESISEPIAGGSSTINTWSIRESISMAWQIRR